MDVGASSDCPSSSDSDWDKDKGSHFGEHKKGVDHTEEKELGVKSSLDRRLHDARLDSETLNDWCKVAP